MSRNYEEEVKEQKLRKVATYIHDLWYAYKNYADLNREHPTADGFFEWLEGEIL